MFDILELHRQLVSRATVSGGEQNGIGALLRELASPFADEITTDAMGNLICHKKGEGKRIMLAAHMDAIGFMVTGVDENGFVSVAPIGGHQAARLMGCRVVFPNGAKGVLCLREAGKNFFEARHAEGLHLQKDLTEKLDHLSANVDLVVERAPGILEEYKQRLREKTKELLEDAQMDESRIAAEVILFADKICTDEETVRLRGHIRSMREALSRGDGIGRKLDFLAQEMNREANTILSKSNDMETSEIAVELKTEIEKIREQIQNIE